jgi:hypothetical protein
LTEQGDARIIDDNVEARVPSDCGVGEILKLARLSDIDGMDRDLSPMGAADFRCNGSETRLVTIGERDVAATSGELKNQRSTNATCCSRHNGCCPTDCCHAILSMCVLASIMGCLGL